MLLAPKNALLPALLALALSPLAAGQTDLFEDTFDSDIGNWIAEYQWAWSDPGNSSCVNSSGASPQGGGAARWGTGCAFDGPLAGALTMIEPVAIPATAFEPRLEFWSYVDTEACFSAWWGIWDVQTIFVSTNGGQDWIWLAEHCMAQGVGQWLSLDVDLSDNRGTDLLIRFHFDAFDMAFNGGFGWGDRRCSHYDRRVYCDQLLPRQREFVLCHRCSPRSHRDSQGPAEQLRPDRG